MATIIRCERCGEALHLLKTHDCKPTPYQDQYGRLRSG